MFRANCQHPLFDGIHGLLLRHTGIDHIVEKVVANLKGLHGAWVINHFANGIDHPVIELLLTGEEIDLQYLNQLTAKAEKIIDRKIRFVIATPDEGTTFLKNYTEALLLWQRNNNLS